MRLPREGETVLMDHPMASDRYVLARLVAEPTKQFCTVNYLTSQGFAGTPKRRRLDGIKSILHPEADFATIQDAIRKIEATRDEEIKRAKAIASDAIFSICFKPEDA